MPFADQVSGVSELSCYFNSLGERVCKRSVEVQEKDKFGFEERERTHSEECTWVNGRYVTCSRKTVVKKVDTFGKKNDKASSEFFSGLGLLGAVVGGIGGGVGVHYLNGLIGITGGWGVVLIVLGVLGGISVGSGVFNWIGSKFD